MEWKWPGPLKGGVTQSMINKFHEDPFCFVLYYGMGLEEPCEYNQNLLWGNVFHKGLEVGLERPEPIKAILPEIKPHLEAEAAKYSYIYPTTVFSVLEMLKLYNDTFKFDLEMIETEKQFKVPHTTYSGKNEVSLMGKMDLLAYDKATGNRIMGEHKTKGTYDKLQFRMEYPHDQQLNIYFYANKVYEVVYDNILIPEAQWNCPARDMNEYHHAYIKRLYHNKEWGSYPVAKKPFMWIDQCTVAIAPESVERFMIETVDPAIDQICDLYEYVSQPDFKPTESFNKLYFKKPLRMFDPSRTDKFKKNYYLYLTNQIGETGLVPVDTLFKELHGEG